MARIENKIDPHERIDFYGGRGGGRTHTAFRPRDFKSRTSTGFVTRPGCSFELWVVSRECSDSLASIEDFEPLGKTAGERRFSCIALEMNSNPQNGSNSYGIGAYNI